jgi:MFS superfamily sulfate permease-like transporter/carbonic anhydrase
MNSVAGQKAAAALKDSVNYFKPDLGVRGLLPDWRAMFSTQGLREDVIAGLTVACIAIPLSLAIALASSVHPAVGLVSAIIGGIVCAIFGGTPLAVSGPAAAMAVLIGSVVEENGMSGLLVVGLLCGVFQLLSGVFGIGRFAKYIPHPVIAGFTAGIGAIILIGQLPRALGLPPPAESHVFDVITHLGELLHETKALSLLLCLMTLGIAFGLPRVLPKLPAPLIAVIVPSLVAGFLAWEVPQIDKIPNHLPMPQFPALPEGWVALISTAFIVYALASLETLLSSSAADKLSRGKPHDPDQELVGQGLGNIAVSLFGGIPVTGVIARTALNIQAGARGRRSALIHAFVLLLAVFFFSDILSRIPIAVLAGVLLTVSLRMLHPREFRELLKHSRSDALIYGVTFLTIVFVDLIVGVQAGVGAAILITAFRAWSERKGWRARSRLPVAGKEGVAPAAHTRGKLFEGVDRYRKDIQSRYLSLFAKLADGQSPHTLFITCSDSRINPNLITSTEPGELFVVRNVGNIVPPFGSSTPAEGAAIEYAVGVLGVKEIVVCGHTRCGAMGEIVSGRIYMPENARKLPSVAEWLKEGADLRMQLPKDASPDMATELNLKLQLQRLAEYPIVKEAVMSGKVRLHAWVFDMPSGTLREWSEVDQAFIPMGACFEKEVRQRIRAGIQFQKP